MISALLGKSPERFFLPYRPVRGALSAMNAAAQRRRSRPAALGHHAGFAAAAAGATAPPSHWAAGIADLVFKPDDPRIAVAAPESPLSRSPHSWAGFVLQGDWR